MTIIYSGQPNPSQMSSTTAFIKLFLSLIFLVVDVFVLMGIRRQTILASHPIMILNAALFTTEILKIGAQVTNEYPVEIAGRVIIDCPYSDIWAVWSLVPWFSSIYLYPILAILHLLAIYRPVHFKTLKKKSAYIAVFIVFLLSTLMSLAYIIPSCGIYYSHDFLYWAFDFARPQVFFMEKYNYVLTITAISITIAIDILIIMRMIRWQQKKSVAKLSNALCLPSHGSQTVVTDLQAARSDRITMTLTDPSIKKNSLSISYTSEIRLAVNFLMIFIIFVWEFIAFNVLIYFEFECSWLISLITSIVSNAKFCMRFRSNIVRFLFSARVLSNSSRFPSMDRLANTKSPYILQHKNNPVEWYPWGAEAFERAKSLNRPIFLSVGYSTCHWCHVMERESFENQDVADILNANFVSIKVDREERPDVDKLYMSFIQALNGGSGGWPMSVFLTPNLAPITGGTYFPPEDRWNQMGFKSILRLISDKWKEDPEHIKSSAGEVLKAISERTSSAQPGDPPTVEVCFMATFQKLKASFDEENGGFGDAPKFPKPVDLSFLLRFAQSQAKKRPEDAKEAIRMLTKTLHAIYHGGIHDHVGKGFHRYSVDGGWHVPHFEKMAYDQGQLLSIFSDVALLTGDDICKRAARDIVEYLEENLSQKDGGFWSAEDADSYAVKGAEHKKEGAFCVWKEEEVKEVLQGEMIDSIPLSDIVIAYYGIKKEGNAPAFTDPHDELKEQNILIMHNTHEEMTEILGVKNEKLREAIKKAKSLLFAHRSLRPKPHLDSKMVTSWQGLIISGLARAAIALGDPMLARRAQLAVDFVKENLRSENGDLIRAVYTDEEGGVEKGEPIVAFADDYSFLIQGLLDLYETTLDEKLIEWAEELQKKMDAKFWEGDSGYFVSEEDVVADGGARMIDDQDGAEPCASSVGMNNVVRLSELLETDEMVEQAEKIVSHAAPRLAKFPFILSKLLEGYERMEHGGIKVVIVAQEASDSMPFLSLIRQYLIPNLALIRLKPAEPSWLSQRLPSLEAIRTTEKPSVFICEDHACGLPITTVEDLKKRLEELSRRSILVE